MNWSKKMAERTAPTLSGVVIAFALIGLSQFPGPLTTLLVRLDGIAYDLRLTASLPSHVTPDERIVIVTIDERSLAEVGHWPWSRDTLANFTQQLFMQGVLLVGFDVLFSETAANPATTVALDIEKTNPPLATKLRELAPAFDYDHRFATALRQGDSVLAYTLQATPTSSAGNLPTPLINRDQANWHFNSITEMFSYTATIPTLQAAATGNAFITTQRDLDGVLRRVPLLLRHGNGIYPGLSLEMARLYLLLETAEIQATDVGDRKLPEAIKLGSITVPIDESGLAVVPYRGPSPAFVYISATDVIHQRVSPTALKDRIVLVGATALGLNDLIATPVQSIYPGVEVHASMLAGMLDGTVPQRPSWALGANLVFGICVGLVLALTLPWSGAIAMLTLGVTFTSIVIATNWWFWKEHNFVLDVALPLLIVVSLTGINLTFGFLRETRQRGQLRDMFGHYVPPQLVEIMTQANRQFTMDGESRQLTVLFADIRGFTTLSENLHPNDLKRLLNHFFNRMTEIIFKSGGTIDKYVGDMIMAFWGAPLEDSQHQRHAIEAAMNMINALQTLNPELQELQLPTVSIGIGINTGLMNVGDMGSSHRRAYTVIGDSVNLASRLEGLTKYYGAAIVAGEDTVQAVPDFIWRKLDRVKVKGKNHAVTVYEPIGQVAQVTAEKREELDQYHRALDHYYARRWAEANEALRELARNQPNLAIYALYLSRIASLECDDLPTDWDGTYERRTK